MLPPGTWIVMYDYNNWVKSLPDPQLGCIKSINPCKPNLKPIKLGQQLGFDAILSH